MLVLLRLWAGVSDSSEAGRKLKLTLGFRVLIRLGVPGSGFRVKRFTVVGFRVQGLGWARPLPGRRLFLVMLADPFLLLLRMLRWRWWLAIIAQALWLLLFCSWSQQSETKIA